MITGAGGGPAALVTSSSAGSGGSGGGAAPAKKLGPPYPVVLAHGFFGFEDFAGANFITYFYRVKDTLATEGETVYTPAVDPFNDSTYRGAQLLKQVQQILDQTGYEKVNIIGHSQGGLDARYVAHERPDLVASVVTVATPHHGSRVADVALKLVSDPHAQDVLDALVRVIGAPLWDQLGHETSVVTSLRQLSTPGAADFNAKYPDVPGIFYASIGGRSSKNTGASDCSTLEEASFLTPFNKAVDPINPLLSVTALILDGDIGQAIPNDGMVRAIDSRWGHFWGCVPADHLDEIGQILGENPGSGNTWKYIDFYRAVIKRLRQEGY